MRVLFAIDTLGSGGAQRQAVELAVRLVERGEVSARFAVYHANPFFRPRLDRAGIAVTVIPKPRRYDPFFPRRMRADLKAAPVDVIHSFLHAPGVWSLLARRGLPRDERPALIASERNDQVATSHFQSIIHRVLYRGADAVTVNAEPIAGEIERRCGVERARIHYIPNGIELGAWDRSLAEECPLALEPGCFHIGLIGRAAPQKHHDLLMDALARIDRDELRSWRVWLIGDGVVDGELGRGLQERARASGLDAIVRFVPEQQQIAAVMARLSVLVLCSRHEGFPNVVLEAMASRLPVVATRVGDIPNMIEPERSGIVVPTGDPDALAAALLRMQRLGPGAREAMGYAGRQRVERNFTMDAIASRYAELYRSLVRSSSG